MFLRVSILSTLIYLGVLQLFTCNLSYSQSVSDAGISELFSSANKYLQSGDYKGAIPYLQEAVTRTSSLTDPQGKETCQTCRFELARAQFQDGAVASAIAVMEEYLSNEPIKKEDAALSLLATGFFDLQEWEKVELTARRLLSLDKLSEENEFDANLFLGQALYRQEKWKDCVNPLEYAVKYANDERTRRICNVMVVGALVKAEEWNRLFGFIPKLYRTDAKYDITLNLTLMQAGKSRYEDEDYLNALLLYRMVLPRNSLLNYTEELVDKLSDKLQADIRIGIRESDIKKRQTQIDSIIESKQVLIDLPPYEDEVTFRIGSIYSEKKRFWEGFVLFDKLYQQDRTSEIGEAAMWQSVLILYDVGETKRAEERIIRYLEENPSGQYARSLLNLMMRDNYVRQEFQDVVNMKEYVNIISPPLTEEDKAQQADLYYLLAFGYFQNQDYYGAGQQFSNIISSYPNSIHFNDSKYFRGMASMLQADYINALNDFINYRNDNMNGEHSSAALFRQAVCQFGLENIDASKALFSEFISLYPNDILVSEAYSYRGDILASMEANENLLNPLDDAIIDYRKGINTAQTSLQSSYAAFKAAEVYKLEEKWQDIIDLMNFYLDRWEESANISEATFWIGRSKIKLDQIDSALNSYLDAINRFGNDIDQVGVDKIILELSNAASNLLDEDEYKLLSSRIGIMSSEIDDQLSILKIRLNTIQAMLDKSEDELGKSLLINKTELNLMSPVTLAILCDVAPVYAPDRANEISDFFMSRFDDSDQLWKAYRAKASQLLKNGSENKLLDLIDEVQSIFGADSYMGWAQLMKANANFNLGNFEQAEKDYELITNIREWKGSMHAESWLKRGSCREKIGDLEAAHTFFQRTYLLFRGYDDGYWAAQAYLSAADVLSEMGKNKEAISTLDEMLNDPYTESHPLTDKAKMKMELL